MPSVASGARQALAALALVLTACGGSITTSGDNPDGRLGDAAAPLADARVFFDAKVFDAPLVDARTFDGPLGPDAATGGNPDAATGGNPDAATGGNPDAATGGSPDAATGGNPDAPPTGNDCVPPTSITLSPAPVTKVVTPGVAFEQAYTATAHYAAQPTAGVTDQTYFTVDDPTMGSFTGSTFHWAGDHGGTVTISGLHCGVVGTVTLTLELSTVFGTPGVDVGDASDGFANAPPSSVAACAPEIVYPAAGILVPPNMNVLEVHFLLGSPANDIFEISFENAATDVRVYTHCDGASAAEGMMLGGGCVFEISQEEWDFVAQTNRDGEPVQIQVRGMGCDGSKAAASSPRDISFAKQDLVGALFYWASLRISDGGGTVYSGGVFKYDFGVRKAAADPVLTPSSAVNAAEHNCIGCHNVSKDGRKMIFDFDDNDADDEFGDVFTNLFDLVKGTASFPIIKNGKNVFPPGFHTWNHETTQFLLSDGPGDTATPKGAFLRLSPTATILGTTQAGTLRGTTPDWAPDDKNVVFAVPPNVKVNPPKAGYWQGKAGPADDLWFAGASLYTAPWDTALNKLGTPKVLAMSNGTDNYYYPGYSPEGSFIVFDHAASGANFHNRLARIELMKASGGTPVDLTTLNTAGAVTNSWARWSPFVQTYKSGRILWVTFSSTRDYGLRIENGDGVNCYPKESPIEPFFTDTHVSCVRSQLWMAAIDLDATKVGNGQDVSHAAFWLPFQELTTNNHLGQWADRSFTGPCQSKNDCSAGQCCEEGGCTTCPAPPPPPPPPACLATPNCGPGLCCKDGACSTCPPPPPPPDAGLVDASPGSPDAGTVPDAPPPPDAAPDAPEPDAAPPACLTCLDCSSSLACVDGFCGLCTSTDQCCGGRACLSSGHCGVD